MAIKIHHSDSNIDGTKCSDEKYVALTLAQRWGEELSVYCETKGDIYILDSVSIFGQQNRDIDLVVMGFFDDFVLPGRFKGKVYDPSLKQSVEKDFTDLTLKSFIFTIELKSHPINKIEKVGTTYFVYYKNGKHDATSQCSNEKFSFKNHLESQLNISPYICDFLLFNEISKSNLNTLRGGVIDNVLCNSFTFKEMIGLALKQQASKQYGKTTVFDAIDDDRRDLVIKNIIDLLASKRTAKGLTRKKLELLSQRSLNVNNMIENAGKKISILRGRAGTGKTVELLQIAYELASVENDKRCIILTYNKALVSDLRRLIDYTQMPTKIDGRTLQIKTIHSFFQSLMVETGVIERNLIPTDRSYAQQYEQGLIDLLNYVSKECTENDISYLKEMAQCAIDWDYVLIDEAQDFTDIEKQILFKLYGPQRIIVADGVDQFMRTASRQKWDAGIKDAFKPAMMKLELRQKSNLVKFANAFAEIAGLDWDVKVNNDILGGSVKICMDYSSDIHYDLTVNCAENDCENYDILILEPPTRVIQKDGHSEFVKASVYKENGINIYDGTNEHNRTIYPTKDESRIYQYDSCRGLEGWCVVCDKIDDLFKYKMDTYKPDKDALGFDPEIIKKRSVLLWMLMPLTRPIDTLVITLSNPNSEIGQMFRQLYEKYEDFVECDERIIELWTKK